jgi:hypothetical protein
MSNLSPTTKISSLENECDEDGINFRHDSILEKISGHFNIREFIGIFTPINRKVRKYEYDEDADHADTAIYNQIVGALMYAVLGTVPDLIHTSAGLSRYSAEPQARHLATAK